MDSNLGLKCQFCSVTDHLKLNLRDYLKHIRLFHSNQADFKLTCGISGCQRRFTNVGTFQNHVYCVHKQQVCKQPQANTDCSTEEVSTMEQDNLTMSPQTDVQDDTIQCNSDDNMLQSEDIQLPTTPLLHSSALFILGLKEKYKLSQVAMQGIIEGVTSLNHHQNSLIKSQVDML